jgi:phosphopantothenoylcysteine decarboxylase/phosphopantothenate--cysteine ligase
MMSLKNKKVLVGLTGGIACYKVPYLIRSLRKAEAEVRVIMTDAATKFVTPLTLETVSGNAVAIEMFPDHEFIGTRHIDLAEWPDLVVIAPATANFLGKVANGICDDLLTTIVCATERPILVAPAMNPGMWKHKPTQRNVAYLKEIGFNFIGPAVGDMACDHWGEGRMVEPDQIFEAVLTHFKAGSKKKALTGKRILVTAGPCREPIDPVRYISNRSSGKMGFALAEAAAEMGAEVTLISGPTNLSTPTGLEYVTVETTREMYAAVSKRFSRTECVIMAAAPADFEPTDTYPQKIKKQANGLTLNLKPTVDILQTLGKKKKHQLLVGFALETENGVANARKKLTEKNLDLIVLNTAGDPQSGFESDTNKVIVIRPGMKPLVFPLTGKRELAGKLLELLIPMF